MNGGVGFSHTPLCENEAHHLPKKVTYYCGYFVKCIVILLTVNTTPMGHDIEIISVYINGSRGRNLGTVETTGMSYNWSCYFSVCPAHFPEKCECSRTKYVDLWHVGDIFGRSGAYVAKKCSEALAFMAKYGVYPSIPNTRNSNWGWGLVTINGQEEDMPPRQHAGVFAYHVRRFFMLADGHRRDYFVSGDDEVYGITDDEGNFISFEEGSSSEEGEDEKEQKHDHTTGSHTAGSPITYFRHPSKGNNFMVHNFKTAMEVYGILVSRDDERADLWYNLAMEMHDAPGKK